jgi:hypothetical protein
MSVLKELDTYDWEEVFGEGTGGNCTPITPDAHPGYTGSLSTFSREDVTQILGQVEGEHDGAAWVVYGKLRDGRFFVARGDCDYTGWDCQAGNSGNVAESADDIVRFGLSESERARLNLPKQP